METLTSGSAAPRREPSRLEPFTLAPDASPDRHAFACVGSYGGDLALLHYLLQDLRVVARQQASGALDLQPYDTLTWQVHGLARRTVICDPVRLIAPDDVCIVGFFGDRRASDDATVVDTAELDVIGEFRSYPGIVSYSSIELIDNQWANLVVHAEPDDRVAWRHSQVHIAAAEDLAPAVYHNVRIHNGCLPSGPIGSETVVIETTKYWDYDCEPTWHAVRVLTEPTRLETSDTQ